MEQGFRWPDLDWHVFPAGRARRDHAGHARFDRPRAAAQRRARYGRGLARQCDQPRSAPSRPARGKIDVKSGVASRAATLRRFPGAEVSARPAPLRASRTAQIRRASLLFVAPAALFFLVLIAYPMFRVLWYSLHYVNLVNPTQTGFAGIDNYTTVLTDEDFWPSLWHSLVWTTVSVAGEYVLGLAS